METWVWAVIGISLAGFYVLIMSLMKVSSRSSRMDEAYYALRPPDSFHKAVMRTDGDTATQRHMDNDTTANRCVCCGEIIPEGKQTCGVCDQKANMSSAWW